MQIGGAIRGREQSVERDPVNENIIYGRSGM